MARIPLSQGYFAEVDDADFDALNQFRWTVHVCRHTRYARRMVRVGGKRVNQYMHRAIIDAPPEMDIDHVDHDGLNNRRGNLRVATRAQNIWNSTPSALRDGVYQRPKSGGWCSRLLHMGSA